MLTENQAKVKRFGGEVLCANNKILDKICTNMQQYCIVVFGGIMPTIRIDEEVYSWLKSKAVPFDDTPNSVLRRLAGLDKRRLLAGDESAIDSNKNRKGASKIMETTITNRIMPAKPAKYLARTWRVNVVHALFHKDGLHYHHLRDFPGALFDLNGYVVFNTKTEYENSSYLQHGQNLHVVGGISSMPGYKRMR
ncbi:MAG: hypothetical protein WC369_06035 [Dehalococcoidales bacterium]|jgi:hypothetical protein